MNFRDVESVEECAVLKKDKRDKLFCSRLFQDQNIWDPQSTEMSEEIKRFFKDLTCDTPFKVPIIIAVEVRDNSTSADKPCCGKQKLIAYKLDTGWWRNNP